MENFWSNCLLRLEKELSPQQYNTWIKPLMAEVHGDAIHIIAPNKFVQQWIKDKFLLKIQSIADELLGDPVTIQLLSGKMTNGAVVDAKHKPTEIPLTLNSSLEHVSTEIKSAVKASQKNQTAHHKKQNRVSGLNAAFNFDNYVTGRANQLARAAAIQVADNPGQAYNPCLFMVA
jgi:chromosomal replication initiator protein